MNTERSRRFPADNLHDSIQHLEKLYTEAKRTPVDSETIAKTIGYKGLNGASKSTIAAMSYYGLIERDGNMNKVSESGFQIIRPLNDDSKREALRSAAFHPLVFIEIRDKYGDSSEAIIARSLLHTGFTEDGAARAAHVYKENIDLLEAAGANKPSDPPAAAKPETTKADLQMKVAADDETPQTTPLSPSGKTLTEHLIPLGATQAKLIFTGEELVIEDYDALIEYLEFSKKQLARKLKTVPAPKPAETPKPTAPPLRTVVEDDANSLFGNEEV